MNFNPKILPNPKSDQLQLTKENRDISQSPNTPIKTSLAASHGQKVHDHHTIEVRSQENVALKDIAPWLFGQIVHSTLGNLPIIAAVDSEKSPAPSIRSSKKVRYFSKDFHISEFKM